MGTLFPDDEPPKLPKPAPGVPGQGGDVSKAVLIKTDPLIGRRVKIVKPEGSDFDVPGSLRGALFKNSQGKVFTVHHVLYVPGAEGYFEAHMAEDPKIKVTTDWLEEIE